MERDEKRMIRCVCYILFFIFLILPFFVNSAVNATALSNAFVQPTVLKKAVSMYQSGDFKGSYQALLILSRHDNPEAFFLLGKMHERGDGVTRDESKAIIYYQKAADLGFDEAEQRIDQLLDGETSVVLDWYLESAWDGDVESVFNLGYLYESGMGVRIDESLALQWYEEAANQQHADAQLRLGLMLIAGAGVDIDVNSGKKWIVKAGKNGSKVAQTLDVLLIKNNKNLDIVKTVRGLRTLDHSDKGYMLQVLMTSVAQMAQPLSLNLLSEKASYLLNKETETAVKSDMNSKSLAIEKGGAPFGQQLINSTNKEEGNLLFWVLISILLTSVFTSLIHYLYQKRLRKPEWASSTPVLPELNMDPNDEKYLRDLWGKQNNTRLPVDASAVIDADDITLKDKTENVYEGLVPAYKFDVQVIPQDISFERLTPKNNSPVLSENLKESSEFIVENIVETVESVDESTDEELARSYVTEQAREYEASQINDVDTVSEARLNIGLMFFHGDGVVKNIPLAIKWLRLSESQGNRDAESELKKLYIDYPEYVEVEEVIDEHEHRASA